MKKIFILGFMLIGLQVLAQTSGKNYFVNTVPFQPVTDTTELTDVNSNTSIQYFDGLGRLIQTVQLGISTNGADLVAGVEYDAIGREWKKYLPGKADSNNGAYVTDYDSKSAESNNDSKPYVTTEYEPSPINRITGQYGAGNDWYSAGKKQTIEYLANDANIANYYVNSDKHLAKGTNYGAGSLYVTKVTDEDGKVGYEFIDKLGRVILKRQILGGYNVDTYYVYNDLGKLCYVLPPKAVDDLTSDLGDDNAVMKQYCYLYQYDARGNCNYKRLPGCEPVFMVYDRANRLILSQDGNQRAKSPAQWTVTRYDELGRAIYNGLINSNDSHATMESNYSGSVTYETYTGSGPVAGYTSSNLTPGIILTVNYYDTYSFISDNTLNYDSSQEQNGYTPQHSSAKGLLTGTLTYHLDDSTKYETTALYYDKFGRVVQSRATNHMGGYDLVYLELKFNGALARSYKTHSINGTTPGITELYTYGYNKAQQPTTTTYSLNGGSAITLASNSYDELGRLSSKTRHSNTDTETYAYNVRSWMTNITSGSFQENLYYNTNPLSSNVTFNGNISYSTWTYNGASKGYLYEYDGLNRLLSASFKQLSSGLGDDSFNETFTYDKMGNILTLKRKKNNTLIDDLALHYSNNEKSNQLQYVDDNGAIQGQYLIKEYQNKSNTQDEFAYDANGNMIKDLDRDIYTIRYNVLNLPDVVQFKNGNQIKNTYNAGGQKLGTEYFTWLPGADAPIVNTGDVLNLSYSQNSVSQNGTAYIGNVEYNTQNGYSALTSLSRIYNTEGYVENLSSPQYYYFRKDHLGSNREVWLASTDLTVQRTQYYPSGLPMTYNDGDNPGQQRMKYNGKEFDEMHGFDSYDYGARFYDPQIGRWNSVDGLAEDYYGSSPYHFTGNNPIVFIDPNGLAYYYSADGTFLGDDGKDNQDIYTTNQDLITKNTDKDGNISWDKVIEGDGTSNIGVFGDFVNMGDFNISSDALKQNLVGFSINMKYTGATEEYSTIQVVGGDRTADSNKKVGGSGGSKHTEGIAADIKVNGMSNENLALNAQSYGKFGGVIFYPNMGDTQGFGTHQGRVISQRFYLVQFGEQSALLPATTITSVVLNNTQTLNPHVHVDMRSKPYLGRYAGNDGKNNTYVPWVSNTQIR